MSVRSCAHLFHDDSCNGCRERRAHEENQRNAARAQEKRLGQLHRDAEKMSAEELEDFARRQRSDRSEPGKNCDHWTFHSDCTDCRHYELATDAAKAAGQRAAKLSREAQSYADKSRAAERSRAAEESARAARDSRPSAPVTRHSSGDRFIGKVFVGIILFAIALFLFASVLVVVCYAALAVGVVAGVARLVMLKTGRCDRWIPKPDTLGTAAIRFSLFALVPIVVGSALTGLGHSNIGALVMMITVPLLFWKVRREFVAHRAAVARGAADPVGPTA